MVITGPATLLAEWLLGLFVFSIIMLAVWRVLRPTAKAWLAWLRAGMTIGICGGMLGACVHAGTMLDQYSSSIVDEYERYALITRWTGPYWWSFWGRPLSLLALSAVLLVARKRRSWWIAWSMAIPLSIPLGLLIMMITSLHRDYLPSGWSMDHLGLEWSPMLVPMALLFSAALMRWAQRATNGGKQGGSN